MAFSKKKRYFYTRHDRHHFLARNKKYRRAGKTALYAVRIGPRYGLIILLLIFSVGMMLLPLNYINNENDTVFMPIGTPAPPSED